jgi:hypothetical protein
MTNNILENMCTWSMVGHVMFSVKEQSLQSNRLATAVHTMSILFF